MVRTIKEHMLGGKEKSSIRKAVFLVILTMQFMTMHVIYYFIILQYWNQYLWIRPISPLQQEQDCQIIFLKIVVNFDLIIFSFSPISFYNGNIFPVNTISSAVCINMLIVPLGRKNKNHITQKYEDIYTSDILY